MKQEENALDVDVFDILLLVWVFYCILICPYTKVEESFNMQAIHDFLSFGWPISFDSTSINSFLNQFDHVEFPGVVPRSFIGAMAVAMLSFPLHAMRVYFHLAKIHSQYICRS